MYVCVYIYIYIYIYTYTHTHTHTQEEIQRLEEQIQLAFETPIDYMVG